MLFPEDIRDITVGMYAGGDWQDITTDVLGSSGVSIVRARRNESSQTPPGVCTFTLKNPDGNYSPRFPTGPYYQSIGRNTPVRVGIADVRDTFNRTVSNEWGTSDSGHVWDTTIGAGGSVLASDWNVVSGVGTHLVGAANAYRISYLSGVSAKNIDVVCSVSLPFTNVMNGAVEPANVLLRWQSSTEYYMIRVSIDTAEAITVSIHHSTGGELVAPVSTGLVHSTSESITVRASIEGSTIRAKVWHTSGAEPFNWQVTVNDVLIKDAGAVGIRSGAASGNTNVPITFSYDDVMVIRPRFMGEMSGITPGWDISGNHVTAEVEASGVLRRLGQGSSPVGSSMRRGMTAGAPFVVAYWPCEDSQGATQIASGLSDGTPMSVSGSSTTFASNSDFDCSDSIPTPGTDQWYGRVPAHTVIGTATTRFLLSVPSGGVATTLLSTFLSGTASRIDVDIDIAGSMRVAVYSQNGTLINASLYNTFGMNGSPRWVSLEYWQSIPGTVAVNLATLEPDAATGLQLALGGITYAGTIGPAIGVLVYGSGSVGIGHISVHRSWSSLFDLGRELAAWNGETVVDRMTRLCSEESIPFTLAGISEDTPPMGPQRSSTLGGLLLECAALDLGTLYESYGDIGIAYRTLVSTYNQDASLTLDYSLGQLAIPFQPIDDDQLTRNDVTVKREGGSEGRSVQETGRLSVLPPDQGGVGRYDTSVTVNAYDDTRVIHMASWLRHLGTVDETRYPQLNINLANPNVVSAGLEASVLNTDIDDKVTIINPKPGQVAGQIDVLSRGYSERLGNYQHEISLVCTPESPYRIIDQDDIRSRFTSDTTTLTSGITDSAVSFQVDTGTGALWTTTDVPFSIFVGGEEMSIGAVSGTSSPQTFSSITRSVNGVVKAHEAGSSVELSDYTVLPL